MPLTEATIDPETLAGLLVGPTTRMNASGAETARLSAADLLHRRVVADTASSESLWLRALVEASPELLTPEIRDQLAAVQLLAVDSYHPNAVARLDAETPQILVFAGLKHLVHFFADYITVLALLLQHRPDATLAGENGETEPEALLFSAACLAVLADAIATNRPPPLLHDMLGTTARRNVELGFRTAMIFVLLHELGHLALGHLADGPLSEVSHVVLIEQEELNSYQADELAADAFAAAHLAERHRADCISSLMFLLGTFALLEAFHGGFSASHPLAINRLSAMADAVGLTAAERDIVGGWIADRVRAFRRMTPDRSAASGGSVLARIEETMPLGRAYAVIAEVRRRVAVEHGELESTAG